MNTNELRVIVENLLRTTVSGWTRVHKTFHELEDDISTSSPGPVPGCTVLSSPHMRFLSHHWSLLPANLPGKRHTPLIPFLHRRKCTTRWKSTRSMNALAMPPLSRESKNKTITPSVPRERPAENFVAELV